MARGGGRGWKQLGRTGARSGWKSMGEKLVDLLARIL
jgi:hypothetical protein